MHDNRRGTLGEVTGQCRIFLDALHPSRCRTPPGEDTTRTDGNGEGRAGVADATFLLLDDSSHVPGRRERGRKKGEGKRKRE